MAKDFRLGLCILLMTATITVMFGFGRNVMVITWPEIIERYAINYSDIGNLTAFHQAAYFLGSLVAGQIAVLTKPEAIISLATITGGVLIMTIGYADHFYWLAVLYGAIGALIALAWVPMVSFAARSMETRQRVTALGVAACGTALGFLINGFVVPFVLHRFGFSSLWLVLGATTIATGIISYFTLSSFSRLAIQRRLNGNDASPQGTQATPRFPVTSFCALLFFCGVGLVSFQTYYSAYLVEDLNFTETMAGQAWIAPGILGIFSGVFLAFVSNRSSVKTAILASLATLGIIFLSLASIRNTELAIVASIIYGGLYFGLFGLFPAYLANTVSQKAASRIFGLANLFLGLGSVTGGIIGGKIAHHFGSFEPFWGFASLSIAVALVLMLLLPSGGRQDAADLKRVAQ